MLNKVQLIGRLGKDPEIHYSQQQTAICGFSLATSERRKEGNEWKEYAEWHNVVAFGTTAENLKKYCTKGKKLYVEGKIQTRKWQDKNGNDRYTTEILANHILFLSDKDQHGAPNSDSNTEARASAAASAAPNEVQFDDDDIPF